jgi:hypothetical protein
MKELGRNVALQAGMKYAQRENPDPVANLTEIFGF